MGLASIFTHRFSHTRVCDISTSVHGSIKDNILQQQATKCSLSTFRVDSSAERESRPSDLPPLLLVSVCITASRWSIWDRN